MGLNSFRTRNNDLTTEIIDLKHQLKQLETMIQSEQVKSGPFDVVDAPNRSTLMNTDSSVPGFEHIEQLKK